jgi:hypothetical protein
MALALTFAPAGARGDDRTDAKVKQLQAELDRAKAENDALRKKNDELADRVVKLTLEAEAAKKDALAAQNAEKLARAQAEVNLKKLEEVLTKLAELKRDGLVPPKPALALPDGVRGEVTAVADSSDVVTLNIGIDAGLAAGHVLDVYRLDEKTPRYLGTVKITSPMNLMPKAAIATFTPARNVPINKLRPEELPRKGDQIRPQLLTPKDDREKKNP